MFTKISKAVLWLSIIGGIIASIAIGSIEDRYGTKNMGLFIPVGIISTFVIAAGFGMLIEISENIQESRDHLYEINNKIGGSYGANSASGNYNALQPHSSENKNYGYSVSKLSAIANGGSAEAAPDFWYCTECGEKNDKHATTCKGCGKYK